jgi:hypothetical protein
MELTDSDRERWETQLRLLSRYYELILPTQEQVTLGSTAFLLRQDGKPRRARFVMRRIVELIKQGVYVGVRSLYVVSIGPGESPSEYEKESLSQAVEKGRYWIQHGGLVVVRGYRFSSEEESSGLDRAEAAWRELVAMGLPKENVLIGSSTVFDEPESSVASGFTEILICSDPASISFRELQKEEASLRERLGVPDLSG